MQKGKFSVSMQWHKANLLSSLGKWVKYHRLSSHLVLCLERIFLKFYWADLDESFSLFSQTIPGSSQNNFILGILASSILVF